MPRRPLAARLRRAVPAAHLVATGVALASAVWHGASALKLLALERGATPALEWASMFHNPADAALFPYVAVCLVEFLYGLFLYVGLRPSGPLTIWRLGRTVGVEHPAIMAGGLAVQAYLLSSGLPPGKAAAVSALALLPFLPVRPPAWLRASLRPAGRWARRVSRAGWVRSLRLEPFIAIVATATLLAFMSVEPVRLAKGPVRLLNEYPSLPERALAIEGDPAGPPRPDGRAPDPGCRDRIAATNDVEPYYQTIQRGQVNHVGHVLNPIGEQRAGKATSDIYFQYGFGATKLFEWAMAPLGGPSYQAYYKALLFQVGYWLLFVGTAAFLFRDARYVLLATGLLAVAYYSLGYDALLLAPGIGPLLHFLDLPLLLVALRFFRTGGRGALALGALGAVAAIAVNALFGGMVAAAFAVSSALSIIEGEPPGRRLARIGLLLALLGLPLAALMAFMPRTGSGGVSLQFLAGWFSWRPPAFVVLLAIGFLAASYLLLLGARDRRDPMKYAFVFLFVYAQGLLVYGFWSGLRSHFWPALPYAGLQLLLVLRWYGRIPAGARAELRVLLSIAFGTAILLSGAIRQFDGQKGRIRRVFAMQQTHVWPFPGARVVSTADPSPIAASLALIEKYSSGEPRSICMLSVFNNLLPFLADRYSIFSNFELQWSLITEAERRRVIDAISAARPGVVFVGREVEQGVADPCHTPIPPGLEPERRASDGRVREMARVFDAIAADYEKVESGPLLSAYRRRARTP